jgi:hypothetical protein
MNQIILDSNSLIDITKPQWKIFSHNLFTKMNQIILDLNNLIDIKTSIIALFLNVPGWKFVLCSIAFVAELPFLHLHFRPGFVSHVVPQNPDDVIVNKPMSEPVIPNHIGSTRKVFGDSTCNLLRNQSLTFALAYQIIVKHFLLFHGGGQEGEVKLDC